MIIQLQTLDWASGRELVVPIPRNVHVKRASITTTVPALGAGAYVANTLLNGFRLEYKGDTIFNRTADQVREMNELSHHFAPPNEQWTIEPERGFKGSESNYLFVRCAPIADISVVPAVTCVANIFVEIETLDAPMAGKRAVDSQDLIDFAAGAGLRKISIPVRKQTILYALVVVRDAFALADSDDAIISIRNETTQKSLIVAQTLGQAAIKTAGMFGVAHNAGFYYIPINISQNIGESIVIDFTLVTPGGAITVETLSVSVLN